MKCVCDEKEINQWCRQCVRLLTDLLSVGQKEDLKLWVDCQEPIMSVTGTPFGGMELDRKISSHC